MRGGFALGDCGLAAAALCARASALRSRKTRRLATTSTPADRRRRPKRAAEFQSSRDGHAAGRPAAAGGRDASADTRAAKRLAAAGRTPTRSARTAAEPLHVRLRQGQPRPKPRLIRPQQLQSGHLPRRSQRDFIWLAAGCAAASAPPPAPDPVSAPPASGRRAQHLVPAVAACGHCARRGRRLPVLAQPLAATPMRGGPEFDLFVAPEPAPVRTAPAPPPAPAPATLAPTTSPPAPAPLRRLQRHRFDPAFGRGSISRCSRCAASSTDDRVTFEFELDLFNSGSAPARAVLVEASRLQRRRRRRTQHLGAFFAKPVGAGRADPGRSRRSSG